MIYLGKAETSPCTPSNQENPESKGDQITQSPSDVQQHKQDQLWPGATQPSRAISGRLSKIGSITQVYAPLLPVNHAPVTTLEQRLKRTGLISATKLKRG